MGSLRGLFSHQSQDSEWQDTVLARLDSLVKAQNDLRQELADHVADGLPTPGRRKRALIYLTITLCLIFTSVSATIVSATFKSDATTAFNQAQVALTQASRDFQPIERVVSKHGAKYFYAHLNKAYLTDIRATQRPAQEYARYNAQGNDFQLEWFTSEYFGQTILAVSSACFGAIAGWLLIPALVRGRSRRRNKPLRARRGFRR